MTIRLFLSLICFLNVALAAEQQVFAPGTEELCKRDKNCILPECNCVSTEIPVNFTDMYRMDQLPQLVVLTIDDASLDIKSYQVYKKLFERFQNPNNCSLRATFFLSDTLNKTSYCLIRNLYEKRHEMAISTVNYTCPHRICNPRKTFVPWNYTTWNWQVVNMRERLQAYSGIPKSEVVGFRAPLLEPAADYHYRILQGQKFVYDSSLITNHEQILWPFTLDFPQNVSLVFNNAPLDVYNGLWELPVPVFMDSEKRMCFKIWEGGCKYDQTVFGLYQFLRNNFLRTYTKNRAPLVVHLLADWLKEETLIKNVKSTENTQLGSLKKFNVTVDRREYRNLEAVIKFVNETLRRNKDVYFVTALEAIEWMRLLPTIKHRAEKRSLVQVFEEEILGLGCAKSRYNGRCDALRQKEPDYDVNGGMYLDDEPERLEDGRDGVVQKISAKLLFKFESEHLFVNFEVIYIVVSLFTLMFLIMLHEKIKGSFKK